MVCRSVAHTLCHEIRNNNPPFVCTDDTSSLCLQAFNIALSGCYHGKRWYTSTLQLQLASLNYCIACRSVPTLHLLVDDDTPRQMLDAACDAGTKDSCSLTHGSNGSKRQHSGCSARKNVTHVLPSRGSEAGCSNSRVPMFHARGVTWGLSSSARLSRPIYALSKVELFVFGNAFNDSVETVMWPPRVRRLVFDIQFERMEWGQHFTNGSGFNRPIGGKVVWPASLKQLVFGEYFNQPLDGVRWPASLEEVVFGWEFNQTLDEVRWPLSLKRVVFGVRFNQRISEVKWPGSLQAVIFGCSFNQSLESVKWPNALQQLGFQGCFDQPVELVEWPSSLREISFGWKFNHPIQSFFAGTSLRQITFGDGFNQEIEQVKWPSSVEKLAFGKSFNRCIEGTILPSSLKQLTFGNSFDQRIAGVKWPASLKEIAFGARFNQTIDKVRWPASLRQLVFGNCLNQPIRGTVFPPSLQYLMMGDSFNHPVGDVLWPSSLQHLAFGYHFNQAIDGCPWPSSLKHLTLGRRFSHSLHGLGSWMPSLVELVLLATRSNYTHPLKGVNWPPLLERLIVHGSWGSDRLTFPPSVDVVYLSSRDLNVKGFWS